MSEKGETHAVLFMLRRASARCGGGGGRRIGAHGYQANAGMRSICFNVEYCVFVGLKQSRIFLLNNVKCSYRKQSNTQMLLLSQPLSCCRRASHRHTGMKKAGPPPRSSPGGDRVFLFCVFGVHVVDVHNTKQTKNTFMSVISRCTKSSGATERFKTFIMQTERLSPTTLTQRNCCLFYLTNCCAPDLWIVLNPSWSSVNRRGSSPFHHRE
jgi:hypothetical protein